MHLSLTALLLLSGVLAGTAFAADSKSSDNTAASIIAMERAALDRWCKGDPDGFLEISDNDVTYFDPFTAQRLNGLDSLRSLYNGLRGKVQDARYELLDPKVEVSGDMAVLTFNFVASGGQGPMRWNTTEVYRRRNGQWRIIHTHWSLTQPRLALK